MRQMLGTKKTNDTLVALRDPDVRARVVDFETRTAEKFRDRPDHEASATWYEKIGQFGRLDAAKNAADQFLQAEKYDKAIYWYEVYRNANKDKDTSVLIPLAHSYAKQDLCPKAAVILKEANSFGSPEEIKDSARALATLFSQTSVLHDECEEADKWISIARQLDADVSISCDNSRSFVGQDCKEISF